MLRSENGNKWWLLVFIFEHVNGNIYIGNTEKVLLIMHIVILTKASSYRWFMNECLQKYYELMCHCNLYTGSDCKKQPSTRNKMTTTLL